MLTPAVIYGEYRRKTLSEQTTQTELKLLLLLNTMHDRSTISINTRTESTEWAYKEQQQRGLLF